MHQKIKKPGQYSIEQESDIRNKPKLVLKQKEYNAKSFQVTGQYDATHRKEIRGRN